MINKLLDQIIVITENAISVVEIDSSITVDYIKGTKLTEEQIQSINSIIANWPLVKIKLEKIERLDNNWKEVLQTGWLTPYGYSLGIDIQDVALLNGVFTLAKEASLMGMTDPVSIVDLNGASHSLSLQDLTLLMLQYGQARASLSNSYAAIKQSINEATNAQELEAININI